MGSLLLIGALALGQSSPSVEQFDSNVFFRALPSLPKPTPQETFLRLPNWDKQATKIGCDGLTSASDQLGFGKTPCAPSSPISLIPDAPREKKPYSLFDQPDKANESNEFTLSTDNASASVDNLHSLGQNSDGATPSLDMGTRPWEWRESWEGIDPGIHSPPTDLNTAFRFGFGGGVPIFTGSRSIPAGFNPTIPDRFPGVDQSTIMASFGFNLGLSYVTDRFGTIALDYRLLNGSNTVAYVTAQGPQDPLVAQFISPSDDPGPEFVVPDSVGSCLVSTRFTLNQFDLTYMSPPWALRDDSYMFGVIGARGATFLFEDYTTSSTVFQQAKSLFLGAGPIAGVGWAFVLDRASLFLDAVGGDLPGSGHQLDREMVIANGGTQFQAVELHGFQNVELLSVEAGFGGRVTKNSSCYLKYRFDQWWGLDTLGGSTIGWINHGFEVEFCWSF